MGNVAEYAIAKSVPQHGSLSCSAPKTLLREPRRALHARIADNLGPASKLLQEGGQECVALQHIQRVRGSDHLPLLRIRELEGQGRLL